jgi:hypothetical protein
MRGWDELVGVIALEESEEFGFSLVGISMDTGEITWERPGSQYGLGVGEVYVTELIGMPEGVILTGYGDGITVDYLQAFVLALDVDQQVRCLGLLDPEVQPELMGGPVLADAAAANPNRLYTGGFTFSGKYRTMVSAWDLP